MRTVTDELADTAAFVSVEIFTNRGKAGNRSFPGQDGIDYSALGSTLVGLFRSVHAVYQKRERIGRGKGELGFHGLARVVVGGVIPAVVEPDGSANLAVESVLSADAGMGQGFAQGKQEAARFLIIEVVVNRNDFGSQEGDVLAGGEIQP